MNSRIAWHCVKAVICAAGAVLETQYIIQLIREQRQDRIWMEATLNDPVPAQSEDTETTPE